MRKSLAFYLCLFLILAGCSKTATEPSPQPINPSGVYTVNYTEKSGGTCGSQTGATITIAFVSPKFTWDEGGIKADFGSMTCTADNCKGTVSTTFSGVSESYDVTITSTGMTGTQAASVTGSGACSSTYTVTGTKK